MSGATLTPAERSRAIDAILDARREVKELEWFLDRPDRLDESERTAAIGRLDSAQRQLVEAEDAYENTITRPLISRCPFTGKLVQYPIDTVGLDGPFWDAEQPVRPPADLPSTFFALTGAIGITGKAPDIPFAVRPGPAVPWVSPRLLSLPGVRAVVSQIRIGHLTAWPITYFALDPSGGHPAINTWGTDSYVARHRDGSASIEETWELECEYDFNLAPWFRKGRLLWIAPGDHDNQLRSVLHTCPYLGLEGYRYPVLLRGGAIESSLLDGFGVNANEEGT